MQNAHNTPQGLSLANPIPPDMRADVVKLAKASRWGRQMYRWLDESNQIQRKLART